MSRIRALLIGLVTVAAVAAIPSVAAARHGRHHGGRSEVSGTVASFHNHVLSITMADGSAVSGTVTRRTEIECESGSRTARAADHGGPNGEQGSGRSPSGSEGERGGNENEPNDPNENEGAEDPNQTNEPNENEVNDPEQGMTGPTGATGPTTGPATCGMGALVTGASVRRARLETRHGVVTFKQVQLGA